MKTKLPSFIDNAGADLELMSCALVSESFACLLLISNSANEVYPRWLNTLQPVFKYILTHDQCVSADVWAWLTVYDCVTSCMDLSVFFQSTWKQLKPNLTPTEEVGSDN